MFGHGYFGSGYFGPSYFGPVGQSAVVAQVLNYGVMRRRREEYERREQEGADEFAHEIAARIEEGLPEPLRPADEPEPASPGAGADELDAATLALSRAAEALATDQTAAARIAAAVEAQLRRSASPRIAQPSVAAIVTALCDDDDEEEAIVALLLAA